MDLKNLIKEVAIFVLIAGGIIYGLPVALSAVLNTTHPMAAISSNSMWPVLEKGDLILIKGANKDDIKIGDVVVYEVENGFIIHRVVKLMDKSFVTKGDANTVNDQPIKYDKVVGKTINLGDSPIAVPYLGNITAFASR